MSYNLNSGISNLKKIIVDKNDTALAYDSGTIEVYATPAMISLMESTAKDCVEQQLSPECTTVGTQICVKHIKASPVGAKVECKAILKKIEGKKLFYDVIAWDQKGKIGEGTHIRYIVNTKEFMGKL